uniref:Uncharacterized protein n=1 Tax=Rhizophora mucronata TaxID=61149 RepID=A0A2P2IUK3_RHIMU
MLNDPMHNQKNNIILLHLYDNLQTKALELKASKQSKTGHNQIHSQYSAQSKVQIIPKFKCNLVRILCRSRTKSN